ncbi:response regulator [Paenibacillus aceris]|uniref:DNA-binding response OmpR family regulator n=1 Tax=Paenibacillus aceris TaxID=869555 RepID=A0ABS4IAR1_9BACL|nr:response regulator transcription factor [Paenibacillus aceris]MBP1967164.1 DNA-binding response OmpR family regulator [Paenibacillus aceris]NHW35562.1 response regulator transcription factor [Paenibacillus aceris]
MAKQPLILIVEDERRMRELIADYLEEEGFEISQADNGYEALDQVRLHPPDLVVLDIMMPGMDGFEVCKHIRNHSKAIIVMLTAKSEEEDKLHGYELGADDYVTKPFSPKVLTAKIKALLNRWISQEDGDQRIKNQDIEIDEKAHEVYIRGELLELSPKEYDLLLFFTDHPNVVLTRDALLDRIWGMDYYGDVRTVDTHIKRLRKKLGDKADCIQTVRGNGYKFQDKR